MEGKFIVLDGGDGAGKKTQLDLLKARLETDGYTVHTADFPQYGTWSAKFVEKYLNGEFGPLDTMGPKKSSLFYALDRYAASFQIKEWLESGHIVLSNRYVSANKGHQLGKIINKDEMGSFLNWLNETEYETLELPVPDLTLFLHMRPDIGQRLVDAKGARDYVGGEAKRDLHEADLDHLVNAERAFLYCLENDEVENWDRIVCYNGNEPLSRPEIHQLVYEKVSRLLVD
ncbi:thymidylate kinase [archaeon]|nr:thymidylate kinase [archaeon]|tara:strand:+ start:1819 stop:2508 length:690 start_codon:yes stop_codon:yes gene_type:complete